MKALEELQSLIETCKDLQNEVAQIKSTPGTPKKDTKVKAEEEPGEESETLTDEELDAIAETFGADPGEKGNTLTDEELDAIAAFY